MQQSVDNQLSQILLQRLCSKITGLNGDDVVPHYEMTCRIIASNIASASNKDEFNLVERIKKKLVRANRDKDAAEFAELYRKLQSLKYLRDRWSVLYLLHRLSEENESAVNRSTFLVPSLPARAASTPFSQASSSLVGRSQPLANQKWDVSSVDHTGSSLEQNNYYHNVDHSSLRTPLVLRGNQQAVEKGMLPSAGVGLVHSKHGKDLTLSHSNASTLLSSGSGYSMSGRTLKDGNQEISESQLLRDIVYVLQGIEGKYLKYDVAVDEYKIHSKLPISLSLRKMALKLAECGILYKKIRNYADARSSDRAFGLVGQSFCSALQDQLTEYYGLMAVLESQLSVEEDAGVFGGGDSTNLTLRKLNLWMMEPMARLKMVAALVDVCQGKKGGSLASSIHSYLQHGDPLVRNLASNALAVVSQPIFSAILRWIHDGELEDVYHEFFVASDPVVKDDRLWHDKYSLRKSMIPSFISMDQAKKILLTGKTIHFLRQVCSDRTSIRDRDVVKAAATSNVETIFTQDLNGFFQKMIDAVYKETSMYLLQVLHHKFKFMEHLKQFIVLALSNPYCTNNIIHLAMRRYLLLGQGDFIRHLMDLLEEDLAKPAQSLFMYNLNGILESAIRATNAQYDDADILRRLDVRLLELSHGDTGWDVFSLEYHISGHIRTVFTTESMRMYLRVFNFLWRAKRMEYILSMSWKEQISNAKYLRSMPEVMPMLHQSQLIVCEMMHFVQQIQYYINFEVLECSWDQLLRKVTSAEDLDQIIAAHQEFLDTITTRCLLDARSTEVFAQLRTIFDRITHFQTIQEGLYSSVRDELSKRQNFEKQKAERLRMGQWSIEEGDEEREELRRSEFFDKVVIPTKSQLRLLTSSYQDMVQQFLVMLMRHSDASLRFLSFRLDFNEHYNTRELKKRASSSRLRGKASSRAASADRQQ